MASNQKSHIRLEGFAEGLNYEYPRIVVIASNVKFQDRTTHGTRIKTQLETVRNQLLQNRLEDLPEGIVRDDAVYVEFTSEWGYPLKFESLEQNRDQPQYAIMNIKEEVREIQGEQQERYHVAVMMTEGGISKFIHKAEEYLTENTKNKLGQDTGKPKNGDLLNNIRRIQAATLKSFWTDGPEIPFPSEDTVTWWEAWFRRKEDDDASIGRVLQNLKGFGVEIGMTELIFPEHKVRLIRGTALQLSKSLMLLDNLAELRKPQEIADFLTHDESTHEDHVEWLDDLIARVDPRIDRNSVLICLLDSGVNNNHPLIAPFLPDPHLHSYKPEDWSTYDSGASGGHGTGVAGLALYGDLVDALASPHRIQIAHGLESFKIIETNDPNAPEFYGPITEYACTATFIDRPDNLRVFCMTVTAKDFAFRGRPSAWSSAVDKIAFGSVYDLDNPDAQLLIVSGGNVEINNLEDHPSKNYLESVHDPAQAYNCLTVGSYTRKDRVDQSLHAGWAPLAQNGAMAPSNSTSTTWEHQWPIKPDIVMEGGNISTNGIFTADHACLKVLTADKDFPHDLFKPFGDTSGAAALAAKMAAELRTAYPNYWPETIRGLMVHSAEWTDAMLGGRPIANFRESNMRTLLRSVGYGVPNKEKAMFSANNSLTLIAERFIQPYQPNGSNAKYKDYHLFTLPWPADILGDQLYDQDVTLKVTLSYFIEPNPGSRNKSYANTYHYHSHSLDFAVIKANESLDNFKRRVSAAEESMNEEHDGSGEPWIIKKVRSRGSVSKDFITMSGADMARRNVIAVYPKGGWYKTRKKMNKVNSIVRYSLIISVETPITDVDLYTPVYNYIENIVST